MRTIDIFFVAFFLFMAVVIAVCAYADHGRQLEIETTTYNKPGNVPGD